MKWLCWFRHDWSLWSAPKDEQTVIMYDAREYVRTNRTQGKFCYRCGHIKERVIRALGEKRRDSSTI